MQTILNYFKENPEHYIILKNKKITIAINDNFSIPIKKNLPFEVKIYKENNTFFISTWIQHDHKEAEKLMNYLCKNIDDYPLIDGGCGGGTKFEWETNIDGFKTFCSKLNMNEWNISFYNE